VHEKPVALDEANKRVPAALSTIVMRCLEKNPSDRYPRGTELADALIAFLASASGSREYLRHARSARLAKGA
jgi:serine/threonine-protein kinase